MAAWIVNALKWIVTLFAPQIFEAAKSVSIGAIKFCFDWIKSKFKKKENQAKEEKLIDEQKKAKTNEEQENAFKNIVDHGNGD